MPASPKNRAPEPGFGLYIHWPFCRKKCPYCDFNSHVRDTVDQARWTKALLTELDYFASRTDQRQLTSIFFGGGTPSLMSPETVGRLIEGARERVDFAQGIEITLEANPTSAEATSFAGYADAGVTRLSLGVQSLRDEALKFLGREHSVREALAAIELARGLFPNISFDLIYALPGQSAHDWRQDLEQALALAGDHLSLYQLTIEPNTGFAGAVRRGEFFLPDEENAEELFELTQEICTSAGLPAYEISNHARPGFECRHNLTYWRYGEYIGVGPGAHGRLVQNGLRTAFQQKKRPESWLVELEQRGHATEMETPLPDRLERGEELLLMGLRLEEGVWFDNFTRLIGAPMDEFIHTVRLRRLMEAGLMERDDRRLRATQKGRFVLNSLLAEILL
ncbi:MAG: coproporphyrinogen III oxidase [Sneathiella sp.]|jgi:oxygen-independent coproporphyrinogen-3 oxidase|uniref:radical SAM family heme chaperone HemW n=1 Tax=Sneathiella sp. TaxID=1964365 RepID=UPI000C48F32D|nr:radical SAM family heme chaperone HemW [Sneathiella sp.]MAL79373.1 coproporphyrinogen III oxidase [Sneathiella sp.]